jgi:hypothetical protein
VLKADERQAAEMLRRILDAMDRGELTADTPEERRNVRRLEGMLLALRRPESPKPPTTTETDGFPTRACHSS